MWIMFEPRFLLAALVGVAAQCAVASAAETGWDAVPAILQEIKTPTFPERDFPVTAHGAKGDGITDCRPAFDKAISACSAAGGGRVVQR